MEVTVMVPAAKLDARSMARLVTAPLEVGMLRIQALHRMQ
jgi:hypothetical protein